jgi:hypothetical protein
MALDNPLIIGILLIVVSLALGLLAIAFWLNRSPPEGEQGDPLPESSTGAPDDEMEQGEPTPFPASLIGSEEPAPIESAISPDSAIGPAAEAGQSPPLGADVPGRQADAEGLIEEQAELEARPAPESGLDSMPAAPEPSAWQVALDPDTGKVVVSHGPAHYRSLQDIAGAEARRELESLILLLQKWLPADLAFSARTTGEGPSPGYSHLRSPMSMVEEINAILEVKVAEMHGELPAIRLYEGSAGTIRVFYGVNSYTMEDVPNEAVRQLIRDAVVEWEARR